MKHTIAAVAAILPKLRSHCNTVFPTSLWRGFLPVLAAAMTAGSAAHADTIVCAWGGSDASGIFAVNLLPDG